MCACMRNLSGASTNGRGLEGKVRQHPTEFYASSYCLSHLAGKNASVSLASLPDAMDKRHQLHQLLKEDLHLSSSFNSFGCWSLEPCKCNWLQTTNLETYYWNISAAGAALQACTKWCYVPSHGCFDMHLFHGFPWCRASSDSNNHSCQLLIISVLPGLLVSAIPVYLGIIRRYHAVSLQSCIMCFRQSKK